jgi:hypothetical protein
MTVALPLRMSIKLTMPGNGGTRGIATKDRLSRKSLAPGDRVEGLKWRRHSHIRQNFLKTLCTDSSHGCANSRSKCGNGGGSSQQRAASPKWRPVAAVDLGAVPLRSSRVAKLGPSSRYVRCGMGTSGWWRGTGRRWRRVEWVNGQKRRHLRRTTWVDIKNQQNQHEKCK